VIVEESLVVARPPEDVFAVVADLERAPEWQDSLESVDVKRGIEVRNVAGRRREGRFELKENDPPRMLAIESRSGSVRADARFTLSPVDGGTGVDFRLALDLGTGGRLAAAMVRGRVAREARQNLERLSELLEA
jgi:uncharacterized membrane protein